MNNSNGTNSKHTHGQERILSVDVLRGFDMFWLIGGTGLALAIVKLFGLVLIL